MEFQFTPLHERQRYDGVTDSYENVFQFTPLHERQPPHGWYNFPSECISIHAST